MGVPEYVYQEGIKQGCTMEAFCALLAQLQEESAFNPYNLEDTANKKLGMSDQEYVRAVDNGSYTNFVNDDFGFGLFQVTYHTRKRQFLEWMKAKGLSIGNTEGQVAFIWYEMKKDFPGIWEMMKSSHDLYELTKKLLYTWENPLEKEKNLERRYEYAKQWMNKLGSGRNTSISNGGGRMTKNEAIEKVLNIARSEIGYHEQGDNITKYAAEMDQTDWYNGPKNGFPYCDVFYDWLFKKAFGDQLGREMICQPAKSAGAGCLFSAQYYKQHGRWTNVAEPGAQIFFSYSPGEYSHTGIVESVNGGTVTTIEGNTSDSVGRRQYPVGSSNIVGYGIPRWELATGSSSGTTPTPSVDPVPQPSGGGIIRKGAKGAKVRELQEKLIKLGFSCGPDGADGDFGNNTRTAVIEFQKKAFPNEPVEWDGEVGPKTQAAIEKALAEKDKPVEEKPSGQASAVIQPTRELKAGEYVRFKGGPYYASPLSTTALNATPGRAKLISVRLGVKHPYRLQRIARQGSNVNGWVDADSIEFE